MESARHSEKDVAIADLRELVDELYSIKINLKKTLHELRPQFFDVSNERTVQTDQEKTRGETSHKKPPKHTAKSYTRNRKKKSTREEMYADHPAREIICTFPEEERLCGYCNAEMALLAHSPALPSTVAYIMFHKTFMGSSITSRKPESFSLG